MIDSKIEKMKYWCHKIIPLVYDESLSYYEFLCKVVAKLNEVIDNENTINVEINEWENTTDTKYIEFTTNIESIIDAFQTSETSARLEFQRQINTAFTEFTSTTNQNYATFTNDITERQREFEQDIATDFNNFLVNYQRQFGVTQYAGYSTIDVISQNTTTEMLKNKANVTGTVNLICPYNMLNGYADTAGWHPSTGYRTPVNVLIKPNTQYIYSRTFVGSSSGFFSYSIYPDNPLPFEYVQGTPIEGTSYYTVTTGDFDRARYFTGAFDANRLMVLYEGSEVISPAPVYNNRLEDCVMLGDTQLSQVEEKAMDVVSTAPYAPAINHDYTNMLTGKTWYACGDSYTAGEWGISNQPLTEGIYAGKMAVYPFWIGNRTGIAVTNIAVAGGTLANTNQEDRYSFCRDGNYNSIPVDTDYVTISFGDNDMRQNVPIGDIDSTDDTTFYGAWNKVLTWLIENCPYTKIGIIVEFGQRSYYALATIAIAAKYGIPTLNMYNDPAVPLTINSERPDVASNVKDIRNAQWRVSNTNSHPNVKAHEYMSYYIENWLMTL